MSRILSGGGKPLHFCVEQIRAAVAYDVGLSAEDAHVQVSEMEIDR